LVIDSDDAEGGGCFEYGHIVREVGPCEHVTAGQRIARINPDRSTNADVFPHLHISFMPYEYNPAKKQDPADRLRDAALPGGQEAPSFRPRSMNPQGATNMTIFGPDISNHQGVVNISQIIREGFKFLFAKVSEGDYMRDDFWPATRDACRDLGLIYAGYHYVTLNDPESQADNFVFPLGDTSIPAMLDFEAGGGTIDNFWAVLNAIEARGVRVRLSYIPRWYWDQIGQPDLSAVPGLIQSYYGGGEGYASVIYPGDDSDHWNGYGGGEVDILQFTEKALIAGQSMDANAFRGTPDELRRLLGLKPATSADLFALEADVALSRARLGSALDAPHPFRPLSGVAAVGIPWTSGQCAQILLIEHLALNYHDPYAIALLEEVASAAGADKKADYPDRQRDAELAALILSKVTKPKSTPAPRKKPAGTRTAARKQVSRR
jgi:Glycosyl hydrolases family 25